MFVAKFLWVVLSLFYDSKASFVKDKLLEIYDIPEELVEKQLVGIQNCMHESEAGEDFIENEVEAEKLWRQGAAAAIASKETAHSYPLAES